MSGDEDEAGDRPVLAPGALASLRPLTQARIALGRSGAGLPTRAAQAFLLDHARAREAVWSEVDWDRVVAALGASGHPVERVRSAAEDRTTYLRRPDLGRQLDGASRARLAGRPGGFDVVLVVADGLSATAVEINAAPLAALLLARFAAEGLRVGPIVAASQARVALADDVGQALGARIVVVLVGERPGLSAADSLGAYVTFDPEPGTPDSRRNCVSNIRERGLPLERAAIEIAALAAAMRRHRLSGVGLKDRVAAIAGAQRGGDGGAAAPDPARE